MKHQITTAILIAVLAAMVLVLPAAAQRGVGAKPAPVGRGSMGGSFRMGGRPASPSTRPGYPTARGRGRGWGGRPGWGWGYLPYPDYYDYYDESDYQPARPEEPPLESAAQPAPAAQPERPVPHLLLERQGDKWVQVTGYSQSAAPAQPAPLKTVESADRRAVIPSRDESERPRELPPAVLVFRDGHEEEVKSYTVIGTTLYTTANYWVNGSWSRKIEIRNLDVPATLKLNQERGSEFSLPSGPGEVVIRM